MSAVAGPLNSRVAVKPPKPTLFLLVARRPNQEPGASDRPTISLESAAANQKENRSSRPLSKRRGPTRILRFSCRDKTVALFQDHLHRRAGHVGVLFEQEPGCVGAMVNQRCARLGAAARELPSRDGKEVSRNERKSADSEEALRQDWRACDGAQQR